MTVLAISKSNDPSTDAVLAAIRARGGRAFRFDTDRFPSELRVSLGRGLGASPGRVHDAVGNELDLAAVTAVWYRRVDAAAALPPEVEPRLRAACVGEARALVSGLQASLACFALDPLERVRLAEHKPLQLRVARDVGLEVPRTLFTNDPAEARAFAAACPGGVVAKTANPMAIRHEDPGLVEVIYANVLTDDDLAALDGLRYSPMIFQERVERSVELRVVVAGKRVFAASIAFAPDDPGVVDWRRRALETVDQWQPYELPREVERGLLAVLDRFGLNYGAFDLIATPDGRHVFLEVNPSGQFAWLDFYTKLPIAGAIADTLLGANRRLA